MDFVFAVSPGQDICYSSDQDFNTLVSKLEVIRGLGVSAFALLFDDIGLSFHCAEDQTRFGGDASPAAAAQAYLLNLIWDNYPVNDFARVRLFLGPLERRAPASLQQGVLGFTANPMNQAEVSKIPLGTVADFLWTRATRTPWRPRTPWRRDGQEQ